MNFDFIKLTGAETARRINVRKEMIYAVREIPDGWIKQYPLAQAEVKLFSGEIYYVLESDVSIMEKL